MTIYHTNDDGEITITFDSRWEFPETFGYKPEEPQYKLLRHLWEEATGWREESARIRRLVKLSDMVRESMAVE